MPVVPGDGCREQGVDIRCVLLAHREGGQRCLSGPRVGAIPALRPDLTPCGPFHVRPPCPPQLGSAGVKLSTSVSPNPAHRRLTGSQLAGHRWKSAPSGTRNQETPPHRSMETGREEAGRWHPTDVSTRGRKPAAILIPEPSRTVTLP